MVGLISVPKSRFCGVCGAVRVLAGPVGGRIDSAETYYTLLRRLPVLEVGVALAMLALVLMAAGG
ncbi:MAG: hypothetical protein ACK40S_14035, partial [Burkholderiaceae bacterium]